MERKELQKEREEWRRREFRRCILEAAEKVIVRKGYGAMTMDDVAHEAQFSKATLYNYYRSKKDLPLEILGNFFEELEQEVRKIMRLRLSAREKLKKAIHCYLRFNEEKENISRMLMMERAFTEKMNIFVMDERKISSEADRRIITKMKTKRKDMLSRAAETLEEGIASGEFRPMDVRAAVTFLESLLQGYWYVRLWHDRPYSVKEATNIIHGFFLQGIEQKVDARKEHHDEKN